MPTAIQCFQIVCPGSYYSQNFKQVNYYVKCNLYNYIPSRMLKLVMSKNCHVRVYMFVSDWNVHVLQKHLSRAKLWVCWSKCINSWNQLQIWSNFKKIKINNKDWHSHILYSFLFILSVALSIHLHLQVSWTMSKIRQKLLNEKEAFFWK